MASLYIKNSRAAEAYERLAARLGTTKTEVALLAADALTEKLDREAPKLSAREKLLKFYREHPMPPPTGLKADKAFYDWLSGEEDVPDTFTS